MKTKTQNPREAARDAAVEAYFKVNHWTMVSSQTAFRDGYDAANAWTLVATGLPTDENEKDCTLKDGRVVTLVYVDDEWYWPDDTEGDCPMGERVIAWRERPEPYQQPAQPEDVDPFETGAAMYAKCGKCGVCAYCRGVRAGVKRIRDEARAAAQPGEVCEEKNENN